MECTTPRRVETSSSLIGKPDNEMECSSGSGWASTPFKSNPSLPLPTRFLPRHPHHLTCQQASGGRQCHAAAHSDADDAEDISNADCTSLISLALWEGGSAFDAWLTASSVQVAQVLLTLPYSFSQLGLASGIALQILYGFMGSWTCYLMTALYADYRRINQCHIANLEKHTIQWYEVLGGLLGSQWRAVGLLFNTTYLLCGAIIQLVACGSTVYYINDNLPKRTWTMVFGSLFMFTILIPTAQNFRVWSFLGILMTSYTAWYLTMAAVLHGQVPNVQHTGAHNLVLYFTGASNILYAFGGHGITVEILDSMWRPRKYKIMYLFAVLYILSITIPSASAVYWAFGDQLLTNPNAFAVLPRTKFRDAAVCLMLTHQFIEFSFCSLPVHLVWEKALGVHHSRYFIKRAVARIPIVLLILLVSLLLPFFGPINSVVGSLLVTGTVYVIPCLAHMTYYHNPAARKNAVEQPPAWIFRSWKVMFSINACIVIWIMIIGLGLGGWASVKQLSKLYHKFGLFAKCYQCPKHL